MKYYNEENNSYSASYRPHIQNKSFLAYLVLSIITLGLYQFYFVYSIARDMNIMCYGDGEKTRGLAGFIILNILTCGFYSLLWYYNLGNRLCFNIKNLGGNCKEDGVTFILLYLVGVFVCFFISLIAMYLLFKNFNKLAFLYNNSNR